VQWTGLRFGRDRYGRGGKYWGERAAGPSIIDELPFGGNGALRDCDPKKVLRRGAEMVEATRLMRAKGAHDPDLAID
jgi:pyruvate/2-oxoglutarate dehydrogenase complex dihydrolipoamide dehydrogenase (E3) component